MTAKNSYMPQLDGLRAVAVIGVVASHSWPDSSQFISLGFTGVRLFFVLSGFLITGILLAARSRAEREGAPISGIFKGFYARRFLRIFPAYYLTLAITWALGITTVAAGLLWHSFYLSNLRFAAYGKYDHGVAHFWSLAVEEQFYLFWPALVLLLPWKSLPRAMWLCFLAAPLFRVAVFAVTRNAVSQSVPVFSSMDCLAAGSLLAWYWHQGEREAILKWRRLTMTAALVVWLGTTCYRRSPLPLDELQASLLASTSMALVFFWVVDAAAVGLPGRTGALLESATMRYMGRISYGLYLYHMLVILLLEHMGMEEGPYLFLASLVLTILAATVSWYAMEKPFNNLKDRFPYIRRQPRAAAAQLEA